jgi:hypothetical protein
MSDKERTVVTGSVGAGELLMIYADPDGTNTFHHKLIDPTAITRDELMNYLNEARMAVSAYKAQHPEGGSI